MIFTFMQNKNLSGLENRDGEIFFFVERDFYGQGEDLFEMD